MAFHTWPNCDCSDIRSFAGTLALCCFTTKTATRRWFHRTNKWTNKKNAEELDKIVKAESAFFMPLHRPAEPMENLEEGNRIGALDCHRFSAAMFVQLQAKRFRLKRGVFIRPLGTITNLTLDVTVDDGDTGY